MTPGESEWTDSHAAGVVDIATLFGIPVPLLGASLLGGSTSMVYQNLTTVYNQWYRDTLGPTYVTRIQSALTNLTPQGTVVELDADALIRPDLTDRTNLAIATFEAGIITVDEARAAIGYQGAPGGLPNVPQQSNREVPA
jgi:phage portal protein BeeE